MRVLMAMSGGIDSTVSAMLLQEQGCELVGVTFRTFDSIKEHCLAKEKGCCSVESIMEAKHMAEKLGFEHHIVDFREVFKEKVISNFIQEYLHGRTPNPCVLCNSHIKWGVLMQQADALGCEKIATGHYACIRKRNGRTYLASAADKWINMGVAGLRLDAVIWVYQNKTADNVSFLKQWYDRCNSTWKGTGGQGDFYMVGEAWCDNAEKMAPYYEGLPSNFNFYYWYTLKDRINKGKGDDFAKTVNYFQNLFRGYRSDFIDAIKLTNHDEDRAGSDLGRDVAKEKLAAAVLLTSPGKPYIYQGEELGYWGTKSKGDEYVRTPIKWTREGSVPSTALNGKVDNTMLTADISVEAQEQSTASVLRVYRDFAQARNAWKALAKGQLEEMASPNSAVALWKMTYEGQTVVVAHNFGSGSAAFTLTGCTTDKMIVTNGVVTASSGFLSLGPYASAVILQ